jgi:hypothetical protein
VRQRRREDAGTAIVYFNFKKTRDHNWMLRPGEPVKITWLDAIARALETQNYTVIFDQAFQSGDQALDESSARLNPPNGATPLTASFGPRLVTKPTPLTPAPAPPR